jgi:hypothetical protein
MVCGYGVRIPQGNVGFDALLAEAQKQGKAVLVDFTIGASRP